MPSKNSKKAPDLFREQMKARFDNHEFNAPLPSRIQCKLSIDIIADLINVPATELHSRIEKNYKAKVKLDAQQLPLF